MDKFEIWTEGYRATCEYGTATFHGLSEGEIFEEAVKNMVIKWPEWEKYFNEERLTYWGCSFFDNEKDARKSFG